MNSTSSVKSSSNYFISITLVGVLFFIFGFITWLNGTLIPFLKIACDLNNTQAYLVTSAFYISYFIMALPMAAVLRKTGFKGGMGSGLLLMGIGALLFIPAANTRNFSLFLLGLFTQGTGLTILQTAVNPYVAILGPIESGAKRISIMGICNKVAGAISPIVLGSILLNNIDPIKDQLQNVSTLSEKSVLLSQLSSRIIFPYIVISVSMFVLSLLVWFSPLPDIEAETESLSENMHQDRNIFSFPKVWLGALAIFFYVGAEVIAGDTIVLFGQSQGFSLSQAKVFTSYTMIAMVVGYLIGIATIPRFLSQQKALALSAIAGLIFTLMAVSFQGYFSVFSIALLGLANAIMWPAIFPLSIDGLGKFTKTASALLIMGIAGGAILPPIYGWLTDHPEIGPHSAYLILIPSYLFIFFFAVKGHKINSWK